jgi:hypothetical protein
MDRRAVRFERGFIFVRASSGNATTFADLSSLTAPNANTEFSRACRRRIVESSTHSAVPNKSRIG